MERAGDVLKKFFDAHDFSNKNTYSNFFNGWEAIVGDKLSGHSRIIDIFGQTLVIEVDHPGVIQIIEMNKKSIFIKLNKKYPEITLKKMKFRVKFDAKPQKVKLERRSMHKNDAKNLKSKEDTNEVESGDLNNLLNKLYISVVNKQMRVDKNQ